MSQKLVKPRWEDSAELVGVRKEGQNEIALWDTNSAVDECVGASGKNLENLELLECVEQANSNTESISLGSNCVVVIGTVNPEADLLPRRSLIPTNCKHVPPVQPVSGVSGISSQSKNHSCSQVAERCTTHDVRGSDRARHFSIDNHLSSPRPHTTNQQTKRPNCASIHGSVPVVGLYLSYLNSPFLFGDQSQEQDAFHHIEVQPLLARTDSEFSYAGTGSSLPASISSPVSVIDFLTTRPVVYFDRCFEEQSFSPSQDGVLRYIQHLEEEILRLLNVRPPLSALPITPAMAVSPLQTSLTLESQRRDLVKDESYTVITMFKGQIEVQSDEGQLIYKDPHFHHEMLSPRGLLTRRIMLPVESAAMLLQRTSADKAITAGHSGGAHQQDRAKRRGPQDCSTCVMLGDEELENPSQSDPNFRFPIISVLKKHQDEVNGVTLQDPSFNLGYNESVNKKKQHQSLYNFSVPGSLLIPSVASPTKTAIPGDKPSEVLSTDGFIHRHRRNQNVNITQRLITSGIGPPPGIILAHLHTAEVNACSKLLSSDQTPADTAIIYIQPRVTPAELFRSVVRSQQCSTVYRGHSPSSLPHESSIFGPALYIRQPVRSPARSAFLPVSSVRECVSNGQRNTLMNIEDLLMSNRSRLPPRLTRIHVVDDEISYGIRAPLLCSEKFPPQTQSRQPLGSDVIPLLESSNHDQADDRFVSCEAMLGADEEDWGTVDGHVLSCKLRSSKVSSGELIKSVTSMTKSDDSVVRARPVSAWCPVSGPGLHNDATQLSRTFGIVDLPDVVSTRSRLRIPRSQHLDDSNDDYMRASKSLGTRSLAPLPSIIEQEDLQDSQNLLTHPPSLLTNYSYLFRPRQNRVKLSAPLRSSSLLPINMSSSTSISDTDRMFMAPMPKKVDKGKQRQSSEDEWEDMSSSPDSDFHARMRAAGGSLWGQGPVNSDAGSDVSSLPLIRKIDTEDDIFQALVDKNDLRIIHISDPQHGKGLMKTVGVSGITGITLTDGSRIGKAIGPVPGYHHVLPVRNSFNLTKQQPLIHGVCTETEVRERIKMANDDLERLKDECPQFPLREDYFQQDLPEGAALRLQYQRLGKASTGKWVEMAYCCHHGRWEFSHIGGLTQRRMKEQLIQRQHRVRRALVAIGSVLFPFGGFQLLVDVESNGGALPELARLLAGPLVDTAHLDERALAEFWGTTMVYFWLCVCAVAIGVVVWVLARQ